MNRKLPQISHVLGNALRRGALIAVVILGVPEVCFSQEVWYELENATLQQINISKAVSGYSGTGYLTDITSDKSKATFELSFDKSELYALYLGFRSPSGDKEFLLRINGEVIKGRLPQTNSFSSIKIGKIALKKGINTFVFEKGWGWYELDYLRMTRTKIQPISTPEDKLIDTAATAETQHLFAFLRSVYGKKMLSAQQTLDDVHYILNQTGVTPAIANIDLMDYSPSRVAFGAHAAPLVEDAISWTKQGEKTGIIGTSWHWNAPTYLINTPDHEWWRGFYTHATTFNFADALADTGSDNFHLLLRDIDAIAIQLKKYQSAHIPILWRPLHEASGGWFWWGAQGPEAYKKLWKLMVTRLRDYHHLHNLIWVYTTGDKDWYPGDEWVDIIGHDIYSEKGSSFSSQWDETLTPFNGHKMVALTESGTLPVPDVIEKYGTWWSWFSLWSGDFVRDLTQAELTEVFTHPLVINREDLPDWEDGIYTSIKQNNKVEQSSYNIIAQNFPNPFNPSTVISFTLPNAEHVRILIFNSVGKKVALLLNQRISAGKHQVGWKAADKSSGIYYYVIQTPTFSITKKMVLIK